MAEYLQLPCKKKIRIFFLLLLTGIIQNTTAQRSTSTPSYPSSSVTTTPNAYPKRFTTESGGNLWGSETITGGTQNAPHANNFPAANLQSGRSTTTTVRPSKYSSTRRSSTTPRYTTFTTRGRHTTTENWIRTSTTPRVQTLPTIDFTVSDSKEYVYLVKWNASTNEAVLLNPNSLRQFTITILCNATYPIEWLSQKSFEANSWMMDEIRHFDEYNSQIIGIVLKLTYVNLESLPKDLDLSCSGISQTNGDARARVKMQSIIKIRKGTNSTLKFQVPRDFIQWPTVIGLPHKYSEPRGSNVDCSVRLKWLEHESKFSCTVDGPANLTFNVLEDCYDEATCERMNTQENCREQTGFNRWSNKNTVEKPQTDLLPPENIPSAGIIYCHKEEELQEKSAVIPFVTSIKKFCLEDDENTRQKLYVHAHPTEENLRKEFISLCASIGDRLNKATVPYMLYAGDNITISAYSSYYYFATGTRIGLLYKNGTRKYIAPLDSVLTSKKEAGVMNFTTKVRVDSTEIKGIFSENYKKKSMGFIQKTIELEVKLPQNITVEYDNIKPNTVLTSWVYTGAPGVTLGCKASGDPQPTIKWHKQGRPISDRIKEQNHNASQTVIISVLEFPSLSKVEDVIELHGIYTCKAENRLLDVAEKTFPVTSLNDDLQQVVLNSSGDNIGLILGIVVPLILLLVGGVVGFLVWKIKRQNQELKLLSKAEVDEFIFGKPEFLHHHSSSEEVNNYAPFLPYNKGYEIAREQLEIDQSTVLGSGAYAIVLCGTVHRRGDQTKVAVKTAKPMDDIGYFKALLSELKIMGFIGCHPNIVNLVGAYTKNIQNREIYIAIEFCANGNLLTYLRDNRQRYRNYVDNDGEFVADAVITEDSFVYPGREGLTTITLMKWAEEIAYGMEFLSNKKVIHGDLAARNILLTEHLVAKIGDFGLSRQLFEYANYIKKQQSPLPWKWLALECLQDMKFSVKSDVWAYSILLYEIFSLGQVPYPGHSYNDEFLEALVIGKRPNKPPSATKDTYTLMKTCWEVNPQERPTFTQIRDFFSKTISKQVPQEYMDLHERVTSITVPSIPISASVHQSSSSENENPTDGNEARKAIRFSFSTKTITAMFHR